MSLRERIASLSGDEIGHRKKVDVLYIGERCTDTRRRLAVVDV